MSFRGFQQQQTAENSLPFFNCAQQLQYQHVMAQQHHQQEQMQQRENCFAATTTTPTSPSRKRRADEEMRFNDFEGEQHVKRARVSPKKIQRQLNNFHINDRAPSQNVNFCDTSSPSSSDEDMMDDNGNESTQSAVVIEEPDEVSSFSLSAEAQEYLNRCKEVEPFPYLQQPQNPRALVLYNKSRAFPRGDDPTMYGRIEEVQDDATAGNVGEGAGNCTPQIEFPDEEASTSSLSPDQETPSCFIVEVAEDDDDIEEMDMS